MQEQRIVAQGGTEFASRTVKNGYSTASLTVGQAVCLDTVAADGYTVTRPATANLNLFVGIVTQTIPYGEYGRVQTRGYNADALVSGGTDVAAGDKLVVKNGVFNLIKAAANSTNGQNPAESGCVVALQAFTTSTAAAKKVILRGC